MHSLDLQELPNSAFHREKMIFHILAYRTLKFLVSFRSVSFRFVSFRCAKFTLKVKNQAKGRVGAFYVKAVDSDGQSVQITTIKTADEGK